jgi:hypothetical protein
VGAFGQTSSPAMRSEKARAALLRDAFESDDRQVLPASEVAHAQLELGSTTPVVGRQRKHDVEIGVKQRFEIVAIGRAMQAISGRAGFDSVRPVDRGCADDVAGARSPPEESCRATRIARLGACPSNRPGL